VPGGQDTITGLSDIKENTINQSEVNFGQFGGTVASLVNVMNEVKLELGKEIHFIERERMYKSDPLYIQDSKPHFGASTLDENINKAQEYYGQDEIMKKIEPEVENRQRDSLQTHSRKSLEENK